MRRNQTKSAAVLRSRGLGLAPALRTAGMERREAGAKLPASSITGPGGVALKTSNVRSDDIVIALRAGGELGSVAAWLERNGFGGDRKAGLRKLFALHRGGSIGFRAAESSNG